MTPTWYCAHDGGHPVQVRSNPPAGERICPDHGAPLSPDNPAAPKKTTGLRRSGSRESAAEKRARQRFYRVVCADPCFFSTIMPSGEKRRPGHRCRYPLDPHHLISKSWIKRELGELPETELLDLIWNPILGVCLCRGAHDAVEYGVGELDIIFRDEIAPALLVFCERFDAEHPDQRSLLAQLRLENPVRAEVGE